MLELISQVFENELKTVKTFFTDVNQDTLDEIVNKLQGLSTTLKEKGDKIENFQIINKTDNVPGSSASKLLKDLLSDLTNQFSDFVKKTQSEEVKDDDTKVMLVKRVNGLYNRWVSSTLFGFLFLSSFLNSGEPNL